jgi:hypothetical protein
LPKDLTVPGYCSCGLLLRDAARPCPSPHHDRDVSIEKIYRTDGSETQESLGKKFGISGPRAKQIIYRIRAAREGRRTPAAEVGNHGMMAKEVQL